MSKLKLARSLLCVAIGFVSLATGQAQVVTPNPAATIITTAPYTITKPGFYQLGKDLYYGGNASIAYDAIITIKASNVTLDFGGHYISGPSGAAGTTLVGVYADEVGNLNLQNGTIAFCYYGVWLSGNGNSDSLNINQRVDNMLISYCYRTGVYLDRASGSLVNGNRISFIGGGTGNGTAIAYGVSVNGGTLDKVSGNIISNVTGGTVQGGGGLTTYFYGYGIECANSTVTSSANDISNITGGGNVGFGIYESTFAVGNTVSNCAYGITGGKYQNNLSSGCSTSFTGGTDAGGNN